MLGPPSLFHDFLSQCSNFLQFACSSEDFGVASLMGFNILCAHLVYNHASVKCFWSIEPGRQPLKDTSMWWSGHLTFFAVLSAPSFWCALKTHKVGPFSLTKIGMLTVSDVRRRVMGVQPPPHHRTSNFPQQLCFRPNARKFYAWVWKFFAK